MKSTDESDDNRSNETLPLLAAPHANNRVDHDRNRQRQTTWTSAKDLSNIKREAVTPVKESFLIE